MISINMSIHYEKEAKDKLGNVLGFSAYIDIWFIEYHYDGNDSLLKYLWWKKIISLNSSEKVISHKFLIVYHHNQADFQRK